MKKLLLAGSGEFTPAMNEIDLAVMEPQKAIIAIIPAAAGKERNPHVWIKNGMHHFASLGMKAFGIPVLTPDDANDKSLYKEIEKANWVYFSGGDPGYLLEVLVGSTLWDMLLAKYHEGMILAGSSAGAMVMGNFVLTNPGRFMWGNDVPDWRPGLDVVSFPIIPHFDHISPMQANQLQDLWLHLPQEAHHLVVGIDEDTSLTKTDETYITRGKGLVHVFLDREEKTYKDDQLVDIY